MSFTFGGGHTLGAATTTATSDIKVPQPPSDSISEIAFCPSDTLNLIAAGAWDGTVRLWNFSEQPGMVSSSPNIVANGVGEIKHEKPVLSVCMSPDGSVFSAGCDNKGMMWQVNPAGGPQQPRQIAEHSAPIKSIVCIPQLGAVATGSWDQSVRFWDTRTPQPVHNGPLGHRVYAMDCRHPYLCVATSNKEVMVFDLRSGVRPHKNGQPIQSQIRSYQTRCLSMFPDCSGFALGNIEGRVAIHYIDHRQGDKSVEFAYKCHRLDAKDSPDKVAQIYAVNAISFHSRYGTFATAGSDGSYAFWDKDKRQRLKPPAKFNGPIASAAFNQRGDLYAYAVSYDWSKGSEHYNRSMQNEIYLHYVKDDEIKPKKGK